MSFLRAEMLKPRSAEVLIPLDIAVAARQDAAPERSTELYLIA